MSRELNDAYFRSRACNNYDPVLSALVQAVDRLERQLAAREDSTIVDALVDSDGHLIIYLD